MRIDDVMGSREASNSHEMEAALAVRYGSGVNEFWLSHGSAKYPALVILVSGDQASLHYFPKERHPGFRSVGSAAGLEKGCFSKFAMNGLSEEREVLNDSIVHFSSALAAAREFAFANQLPASVEWFEL